MGVAVVVANSVCKWESQQGAPSTRYVPVSDITCALCLYQERRDLRRTRSKIHKRTASTAVSFLHISHCCRGEHPRGMTCCSAAAPHRHPPPQPRPTNTHLSHVPQGRLPHWPHVLSQTLNISRSMCPFRRPRAAFPPTSTWMCGTDARHPYPYAIPACHPRASPVLAQGRAPHGHDVRRHAGGPAHQPAQGGAGCNAATPGRRATSAPGVQPACTPGGPGGEKHRERVQRDGTSRFKGVGWAEWPWRLFDACGCMAWDLRLTGDQHEWLAPAASVGVNGMWGILGIIGPCLGVDG